MSEDALIEEIDELEADENSVATETLKEQLLQRCKDAQIETKVREDLLDGEKVLSIGIPNGREKRWVNCYRKEKIELLLNSEFEKYVFIGDYHAICSYSDGIIESMIRGIGLLNPSLSNRLLNIQYSPLLGTDLSEDENGNVELVPDDDNLSVRIIIGSPSREMMVISRGYFERYNSMSLKVTGLNVKQHDQALLLLNKISNSLFFQIDIQEGIPLTLLKFRRMNRVRRKRSKEESTFIQFPKTEFDEAPISLYWYARGAIGMPLLQFLAYYQVIEYYFPIYSQEEVRKKIRAILKDPTFRADKDTDIGRILSSTSGQSRGYGNEITQLRATLNACINPTELKEFITDTEDRKNFFSSKQKGLTERKIPLSDKDADIRNHVADLIYDIRCKIVHTKGEGHEGEVDFLLPFSKEVELLFHDIELIQYISRSVLIAASVPLQI
ncbi:hypothetical protein Cylst_2008 [Cylindrospermum stagnale PCC 7417]|uniref:Uncharacterized protein n=1 Tax=Cylindrospermum stagnale PCC 7417 TaxID=56107 RepID=K9WXK6_9NOST|nr:hypothetical protein [Cylindrospermum stagnale]AFZ24252.1 hypothetical protein Cylst_2008 [Cylindrospermum stagnale PCC 7417]